jgi:hypothetical protein
MFGNPVSLFKVFGFEVKIDISLLRELPVRAKIKMWIYGQVKIY